MSEGLSVPGLIGNSKGYAGWDGVRGVIVASLNASGSEEHDLWHVVIAR